MTHIARPPAIAALALALVAPLFAAKPLSDLVSPDRRRMTVELALRLTRTHEPAPVPADLQHPFNPAGFDQPDPEELKAAAAAYARGAGPAPAGGIPASGAGASQPARQPGDREILESLAVKLPTTGTVVLNGEPVLFLGRNKVRVGDKFTVASNGQDYELELIAIDRTTFTLRYHGEEITRSIKLGKSP